LGGVFTMLREYEGHSILGLGLFDNSMKKSIKVQRASFPSVWL